MKKFALRFALIAGAHFGLSLLIWAAMFLYAVHASTARIPDVEAYKAAFEAPLYIFLKYCLVLSQLPIYWAFPLKSLSLSLLLLNSATFALLFCACWNGWKTLRKKHA